MRDYDDIVDAQFVDLEDAPPAGGLFTVLRRWNGPAITAYVVGAGLALDGQALSAHYKANKAAIDRYFSLINVSKVLHQADAKGFVLKNVALPFGAGLALGLGVGFLLFRRTPSPPG